MKLFKFFISLVLTCVIIWALNKKSGMIPPLGKFLDPAHGLWQNAEPIDRKFISHFQFPELQEAVQVYFDDRMVPHIFAKNDHDLFFMQGYITARDRLWQMDFTTHGSAGRISEIVGPLALGYDRNQRRLGIFKAAKESADIALKDPFSRDIINAYTAGVNTYVNELQYKDFPIEYKLLDYSPEQWTPLKSVLLSKGMSVDFAGRENDIEFTNFIRKYGRETFNMLFPVFPDSMAPIVPVGTSFDFTPVKITSPEDEGIVEVIPYASLPQPSPLIGSNNWAVSGKKTASGNPILCNDPHVRLQQPSTWYEIQLNSPNMNVYGVTLPGAPCITIGFNDSIAWGATVAGRDVKDWYAIKFKDASKNEYLYDGKWLKTQKVVEEIKVRGGKTVYDTIVYIPNMGPVVYDHFKSGRRGNLDIALKWTVLEPSNELYTFYGLNTGKNYQDYLNAIKHYEIPGVNFAFESYTGDIAIWQQGKFPAKWKNQGRFVMDGTTSKYQWQAYIPQEQNPHVYNPDRGFVFSNNQNPVDSTYPYFTDAGGFETYRNRRTKSELEKMNNITPQNMMRLIKDNFNLPAKESLPVMLAYIDRKQLNDQEKKAVKELESWNYMNDQDLTAPSYYQQWWDRLYYLIWDEMRDTTIILSFPSKFTTISLLNHDPENIFFDKQDTPSRKETAKDLVAEAFKTAVKELNEREDEDLRWTNYKSTTLEHYARLKPFSIVNIPGGGGVNIINATYKNWGPSWRMIVEMGENGAKAWVAHAGGQSGNPGSQYYDKSVESWSKGEFYEPVFLRKPADKGDKRIMKTQEFQPKK